MKSISLPAALLVWFIGASAHADWFGRWRAPEEEQAQQAAPDEAAGVLPHAPSHPMVMEDAYAWTRHGYAFSSGGCASEAPCCNGLWDGFCGARRPWCAKPLGLFSSCRPPCGGAGCEPCQGLFRFSRPRFGLTTSACCEPSCGGCEAPAECCPPRRGCFLGQGGLLGRLFSGGCSPRGCGACASPCPGCGDCGCDACGDQFHAGEVEYAIPPTELPLEQPAEQAPSLPGPESELAPPAPPAEAAPAPAEPKSARLFLLPQRIHLLPAGLLAH